MLEKVSHTLLEFMLSDKSRVNVSILIGPPPPPFCVLFHAFVRCGGRNVLKCCAGARSSEKPNLEKEVERLLASGKLSTQEFMEIRMLFAQLDLDGDGKVRCYCC
jgi:hypothetical protein